MPITDVITAAEVTGRLVFDALRNLFGEKVIGIAPLEQAVWITHKGVLEYERSVREPTLPTRHLAFCDDGDPALHRPRRDGA